MDKQSKLEPYVKYSVLMSVYFKEKPERLNQSIECMLNQTVKPSEFVLVKDGELTKELNAVIENQVSNNSTLFKVIYSNKSKKNTGLGIALKVGLENCSNDWVVRMDSDDFCLPHRCEEQFKKIQENPKIDMIGTNVEEFMYSPQNIISHVVLPETNEEIIKFSKQRCPFRHPSMIFRKSKLLECGNYRNYYLCEDYDIYIRMIELGAISYNIQEPLTYMRIDDDFYQRRGGIKYLKSILKFKKEQYKKGYFSLKDYIQSSVPHIIVCLMPNKIREIIYKKFFRK